MSIRSGSGFQGFDRVMEKLVRERGDGFLEKFFDSAEKDVQEIVLENVRGESEAGVEEEVETLKEDINSYRKFNFNLPEAALLYFNVESHMAQKEIEKAKKIRNSQENPSPGQIKDMKGYAEEAERMIEESLEVADRFDLDSLNWSYRPEHLAWAIHDFGDEKKLANTSEKKKVVNSIGVKVEKFVENTIPELKNLHEDADQISEDAEHTLRQLNALGSNKEPSHKQNTGFSLKNYKRKHASKWF